MPRAPKPKELRQNTERVDVGPVAATEPEPLELPKPLKSWLTATKRSWERYWSSPARQITVMSLDLDGLERLWSLYDERERAQRELRKPQRDVDGRAIRGTDSRVVEGSEGQLRPNGLYNVISRLDTAIEHLEDRSGKSAKARLILGMVVGGDDAAREPADEGVDAAGGGDLHDADALPPDPRILYMDRRAG